MVILNHDKFAVNTSNPNKFSVYFYIFTFLRLCTFIMKKLTILLLTLLLSCLLWMQRNTWKYELQKPIFTVAQKIKTYVKRPEVHQSEQSDNASEYANLTYSLTKSNLNTSIQHYILYENSI